ncbi:MAG: gamma-glutamyltransferase [Planctomycetota bacterium]
MLNSPHFVAFKLVLIALIWLVSSPFDALRAQQAATKTSSGVVVSQNVVASEVGAAMLRDGGNAVDAAVATAFALAVIHPAAGNLGGGGFLVWRGKKGATTTFDFREKAPLAATPEMFLNENKRYDRARHHDSHLSVGVPGTVAGLAVAHRRLGRLPWRKLVAPAVALAESGFIVSAGFSASLAAARSKFAPYPASMQTFFKSDGANYLAGDIFRQPELAATLRRVMMEGPRGFYKGKTADLLIAEMRRGGGVMSAEDLSAYRAQERAAVFGRYRGHRVIGMGPPSSGGITLINMLNMLETFPMAPKIGARAHLLSEVMRRGFADRARLLGDPDFNDPKSWRHLISKEHGRRRAADIDPKRASTSVIDGFSWNFESEDTTHLSVIDAEFAAVALTYTLEQSYGSGIVVPGAGFLLNNEMGDFNPRRGMTSERGHIGSEPNLVEPGKRMLSSMCPVIVEDRRGRLRFVLGTPGGRTIINTVMQVLVNGVDLGMGIQAAVNSPRIHHQWLPDQIIAEEALNKAHFSKALEELGHKLSFRRRMGAAECLEVRWPVADKKAPGLIRAGVDPRAPDGGSRK